MKSKAQTWEMQEFKKRLRILMSRYESITSFADAIGVSRQTLGYWLNGDRVPDAVNLVKISKNMEVSTDWLLGLTKLNNSTEDETEKKISEITGLSNDAVERLQMFGSSYSFLYSWLIQSANPVSKKSSAYYLNEAYEIAKDRKMWNSDDNTRRLSCKDGIVELSGTEAISYFVNKSTDLYKKHCELLIEWITSNVSKDDALNELSKLIPDFKSKSLLNIEE